MLACPCASMCPALGWSCVWQCVLLHRHWLVATLPFLFARDTISLASLCCLERSLVTKSLIQSDFKWMFTIRTRNWSRELGRDQLQTLFQIDSFDGEPYGTPTKFTSSTTS